MLASKHWVLQFPKHIDVKFYGSSPVASSGRMVLLVSCHVDTAHCVSTAETDFGMKR